MLAKKGLSTLNYCLKKEIINNTQIFLILGICFIGYQNWNQNVTI